MYIIGLMSGTSLDGLDIALVRFDSVRNFELLAAETVAYPQEWVVRLSTLEHANAYEYALANMQLGHYIGQCVNAFRQKHPAQVDLIASHGHTIFHQPHMGLTTQIGDGETIAAETHLQVVSNFRTLDVALGGQGAPLVPIGDRLLFSQHDACLNLGGIANISFEHGSQRIAFDICPCNMALNHLSRQMGHPFDRDGLMAQSGRLDESLLQQMNALDYYRQPAPKSLGKEWFEAEFRPLLAGDVAVGLRTATEHIAQQISAILRNNSLRTLLATGGGAFNKFLINRMQALAPECKIEVPPADIVNYKEAIIFALLGYLRVNHEVNTLCSVTGATSNSIGGTLSGIY